MYRLGIDIGSKTAKMVLLDEKNKIVFSQYSLHRSNVLQTFSELLGNTIWRFGDCPVQVCVTGSAGMRFAQDLGLSYSQEVIASRRALQVYLPEVDVAIELGGEDAKILFLRGSVEERMNGSCAGGTGGFLDLMCGMLSVKARDFNALAAAHTHIYPIASRCAVFAQADVRPLINAGARKSDIAASVMQAIVTQTISGLACGRTIEGKVAFLGGPCEVYSELIQRFRKTLGLTHAQTCKPENAHLFVASGAALIAGDTTGYSLWDTTGDGFYSAETSFRGIPGASEQGSCTENLQLSSQETSQKESQQESHDTTQEVLTLQSLKDRIDALPGEQEGTLGRLPALFADAEELATFTERHETNKITRSRLMDYEGDIFLGVDAGSTTLKLVAINTQGELLYSAYENNQGDVVETMREVLDEFYRAAPHEYDGTPLTTVRRSLVCGYGEELLKAAFHLESGMVETVAHLRAAQEFCPDASFVLDIGGQDIKCLRLKAGQIDDIMLNEACSSGCGALIQGFARSLGHTKWSFASEALKAENPVDLGTRCTVFMTSRVRHAQKEGVSTADISAGLAYSVVRNALYKVMGINDLSQLGERVVVQGGTFMNDAVLRAFELESGLEVVRPDIANLMGAYGAALLARDEYFEHSLAPSSTILNSYELATLKQKQSTLRCEACTNACNLAVNSFSFDDENRRPVTLSERLLDRTSRLHTSERQIRSEDSVFVSGNRCERGALWAAAQLNQAATLKKQPAERTVNLMAYEQRLFRQTVPSKRLSEENPSQKGVSKDAVQGDSSLSAETLSAGAQSAEAVSKAAHLLGIPPVLNLYEHYVYWQALFSELGFTVLQPKQSSAEIYRKGAAAVLSETVCYPAKLMHGHINQLIADGAKYLFMPTFEKAEGMECPVSCSYGHLATHDVLAFSEGRATLLSTAITGPLPQFSDVRELLRQAGIPASEETIKAALVAAQTAEQHYHEELWSKAEAELLRLEQEGGIGIVLLGHPYHNDPGINHTIDRLLGELGYSVFSSASLEQVAQTWSELNLPEKSALFSLCDKATLSSRSDKGELPSQPAASWTQAARLYRVAEFVADHPRLHAIQLHSFGCGVDALTITTIKQIIQAAGKPYTAIKLDEMVEPATLRIRLRSLDYALSNMQTEEDGYAGAKHDAQAPQRPMARRSLQPKVRQAKETVAHPAVRIAPVSRGIVSESTVSCNTVPESTVSCETLPEILIPGSLPSRVLSERGEDILLPAVSSADVEYGLATLDNDLCYHMLALGGQVLRFMEALEGEYRCILPALCKNCRGAELEGVLNQALPRGKRIAITADNTNAPVLLPGCESVHFDTPNHVPHAPSIGVLGNAAMLFTPEINDSLFERIIKEGAVPVCPSFDEVFTCEHPLPELLPKLYAQGIRDFIFVQSFGCLRSHVGARGALPGIKAEYPDTNITFLEYDPGVSQVNQLSRLKLAVAIACERRATHKIAVPGSAL